MITKESLLTVVALILFIILLKPLGFAVPTFLFSFFTICLYMRKENMGKGLSRQQVIKKVVFAGVFSLILILVVYMLFARVLLVTLP
jgi:hypothetical protein